jgi:flagellar P-ring protein precursor FlgI
LIRLYNINIDGANLGTGSFAMVMVNVTLPPFAKEGMPLNARVSTLSSAESLFGGYLQEVQMLGPDKKVYALASGPLSVSGFSAAVQGTSVVRNHVTTGDVPNGAIVVQEAPSYYLSEEGNLELQLISPDLRTATNIAGAINAVLENTGCFARPQDHTLVQILLPEELQTDDDAMRILTLISPVAVHVHKRAVVAIDASAGVIVAGEGVMISPCVVAVSDLTISVVSEDEVSQPIGWNRGTTETVNRTRIDVNTTNSDIKPVAGGATVNDLVTNLKALQLSPRHLIQVFEKLADAGYLHAELIVK